jgi:hypothetical protein
MARPGLPDGVDGGGPRERPRPRVAAPASIAEHQADAGKAFDHGFRGVAFRALGAVARPSIVVTTSALAAILSWTALHHHPARGARTTRIGPFLGCVVVLGVPDAASRATAQLVQMVRGAAVR